MKHTLTAYLKKTIAVLAAASSLLLLASCSDTGNDKKTYTVAIGQFGEHGSLDNCRLGFIEGLRQEGFVEGENVTYLYKNASFDTSLTASISQGFVDDKADLICAIATPMAQAAFNAAADADIPVVFTAITDPTGAGLTSGNVTGTSDLLPVEAQLQTIRAFLPEAKKIGILYTTSESNSLYTIAQYQSLASRYGFEIVEKGVTSASDVPLATQAIIDEVDCLSNLTDNTVVGMLDSMLDIANTAGKPIFGSEIEQVKKGCVAGEGLEYYQLGIQTGKMAAKILRGDIKASDLKYETVTDNYLYINKDALASLNLTLPDTLASRAIDALTYTASAETK